MSQQFSSNEGCINPQMCHMVSLLTYFMMTDDKNLILYYRTLTCSHGSKRVPRIEVEIVMLRLFLVLPVLSEPLTLFRSALLFRSAVFFRSATFFRSAMFFRLALVRLIWQPVGGTPPCRQLAAPHSSVPEP
jgi:hypothetical protein